MSRDDGEQMTAHADALDVLADLQEHGNREPVDYVGRGIGAMQQAAREAATGGADDVAEMCSEWTEQDSPSDAEEAVSERIQEHCDSAVTYTGDAIAIAVGSDNDGAVFDMFGSDVFADSESIPWERVAYYALQADIRERLPGRDEDGRLDSDEWWAWRAWARKRRGEPLDDDSETFDYEGTPERLDCQRCDATIVPTTATDDPAGVEHCPECGARHERPAAEGSAAP